MRRVFFALFAFFMTATIALADIRADVRELFTRDMDTLDFARVKIEWIA